MKIVILAGGSGTRLWPMSRSSFPKQFLTLTDGTSFFQKTLLRFLSRYPPSDFVIVTHRDYEFLVKKQIQSIEPALANQILLEPDRKNTAPAIALAVAFMKDEMGVTDDDCFLVSPSDHILSPEEDFLDLLPYAEKVARQGHLITFGIRPQRPETGYGYIKFVPNNGSYKFFLVEQFVEKPSLELAERYLLSGKYLWNAGIFLFNVGTFSSELKDNCPEIYGNAFEEMPSISIDYALMEKTRKAAVIPLDLSWSDVGSWDSLYEILAKDENENVKIGNILDIDTRNCLILSEKRLITTLGLEDVLIIETDDALLVAKKGNSEKIRAIIDELKKRNSKKPDEHLTTHRPWGKYAILEEGEKYKIKKITVDPGQILSLQMHHHRSEHWIVVKGRASAVIGENEYIINENESVYVPIRTIHRLENREDFTLEVIEVQVGSYLGEDDIVRYDDIYGRTNALLS